MRRRKLFGAFSIFAVLATVVVIGATSGVNPASAWVGPNNTLTTTVNLDCLATAPIIGDVATTQDITLTTQAPNKVEAGETFDILAQSPSQVAPASFTGYGINYLKDIEVRIPLPPNTIRLAGEGLIPATGFNYGTGATFVWDAANNRYILKTTGTIAGGSTFQLPQVKLHLQASSAAGSVIEPRVGGNSKSNFGFALTVNGNFPSPVGTADVPTACWPKNPNPALSSTLIIPIDTVGPAITITSPIDVGNYGLNSVVNAAFGCNDGVNGTGGSTCLGTVPNLAPVDTYSVGVKSFTVTASDLKGNNSSKTVTYNVVDLPTVTVNPTWTTEGTAAAFNLALSKPWPVPVTVNFNTTNGTAKAPGDYATTTGSRTFAPNTVTTGVISVPTVGNTTYQGNRNFNLQLSGVVNGLLGTTSAEGRIIDNETPPPAAVGKTVNEGPGVTVDFDVSLPFDPGVPLNVSYTTVNGFALAGNDYQFTAGTLTFNPGDPLTQVVSVPVIDDLQDDGYAIDFSLAVTNVATGEVGEPGLAVIIDNDGPLPPAVNIGANIGDTSIVEGDDTGRTAWLSVRLDQPVTEPVTFTYETQDDTATAASKDYKAEDGLLTFQPGQTTRTIGLTITPDTVNEGNEQFFVNLTFVGGGNPLGDAQGVVTILDDDNPTSADYVVSVGDAQMYEGNADLGQVEFPVTINKKRPRGAPDEDVEIQLDIVYGTASDTDVYLKSTASTIMTFPGGVNKNYQIKVRGDTVAEPDEQLTLVASATPNTPGTVTFGKPVGTLTIRDDDGIPGAPLAPKAVTSTTKLGGVDFTWGAPITGKPPTGYEYRVSTDGVMDFEPWVNTGTGLTRHVEHNCGEGASCQYQVRAINPVGTGPESGVVSATGLQDLVGPSLFVFTPKPGANVEDYAALNYNGLIGTDFGDAKTITAKVFACNNCTNIAPTQTLAPTIVGAGWSATGAALSAGVYTLQVVQTDWAGNTTEIVRVFETRPAIFVSPLPLGSDGNPGTASAPKLTIGAALATAVTAGRPQVAVGQGIYGTLSVTSGQGNKTINGGFDQYAGWVRPGSAGVAGTPNKDLSNIEAPGTSTVVSFANNLVFNGLKIHGTNVGLAPGSSVYGVRALSGSTVTLQNVKVIADDGVAGAAGTNGANGANGGSGAAGALGGEPCPSYIPGTVNGGAAGTGGAFNGGKGGNGSCNNAGGAGVVGPSGGGTAGSGGAKSTGAVVSCPDGSPGGGGGGGAAGTAGTSGGSAGTTGTAGTTWAGTNGGNGNAGTSGLGGGGGGAGGGQSNLLGGCGGNDAGGSGGGGGASGVGGALGTGGTAGGGSFSVYVNASTVNLDSSTVVIAGVGGAGGSGGNGGKGGNGGAGGAGGSVTNQNNNGLPTGNNSPTYLGLPLCGLFGIPACYADAGAGAGGGGAGAGGGGAGGGGGLGGPSASVLTTAAGIVNVNGATLTTSAGGAGGAGGLAGQNGTRGELGTAALGAWSNGANAGAQGGAVIAAPAAGGTGTVGFSCKRLDNLVCTN